MSAQVPKFEERRKHRRYNVEPGSFAVFRQDNNVMPGLIVEISLGGLAFIYQKGDNWPLDPNERFHLFGDKFNVEKVSMETVFDFEIKDEKNSFFQLLLRRDPARGKIRRRGVKFGKLTDKQKQDLEGLIREFHEALERQKE
ncbi:MAG: PilZ domain-containing protein [Deltaproteobacteria bacterium]